MDNQDEKFPGHNKYWLAVSRFVCAFVATAETA
jgi:hypothetical protein